jgi:GTPase
MHQAGYVNIIGKPNVGKSTLMNALLGERLSIITSKAQTTRHRILGIYNDEQYQVVFSDTPGHIEKPAYALQKSMNRFVDGAFEDADVLLYITDKYESANDLSSLEHKVTKSDIHKICVINKVDLYTPEDATSLFNQWTEKGIFDEVLLISAKDSIGLVHLMEYIKTKMPESPPYYDKDELTDKPEKFFVGEIIREKIFTNYSKEIPYCTEVEIETFEDEKTLVKIRAIIYVERESQKPIIIGAGGEKLKKVGTEARMAMETFLQKKVFLETVVKVKEDWRNNDKILKQFGYKG